MKPSRAMGTVALVLRLMLAVVFAVAAVAKLADLSGSRRALEEFGVPRAVAGGVAWSLPVVELVIAAGLLPRVTAAWAAGAGLLVLGVFLAAIARAVARGDAPDCHCFGQLHSSRAGSVTLVRNLILLGVAVFVAAASWHGSGASATAWVGHLDATEAALAVLAAVQSAAILAIGVLCWQVLHQNGRLILRLQDLERSLATDRPAGSQTLVVGTDAPWFELPSLAGQRIQLSDLVSGGTPAVIVFSDPACGPCRELSPEIGRWQQDCRDELAIALITRGDAQASRGIMDLKLDHVLLQRDREVEEAYGVYGTPSAVLIDGEARFAAPMAVGTRAVRELVQLAREFAPALRPGAEEMAGHG